MNTGASRCRHGSYVNDEIPDLPIEVILVGVPVDAFRVGVRIDDCDTRETGRCFDCGNSNRIADKLRVIVLDDRRADKVCSRWKVHNSRGYRAGIAA